jgi:hypothetical protein
MRTELQNQLQNRYQSIERSVDRLIDARTDHLVQALQSRSNDEVPATYESSWQARSGSINRATTCIARRTRDARETMNNPKVNCTWSPNVGCPMDKSDGTWLT